MFRAPQTLNRKAFFGPKALASESSQFWPDVLAKAPVGSRAPIFLTQTCKLKETSFVKPLWSSLLSGLHRQWPHDPNLCELLQLGIQKCAQMCPANAQETKSPCPAAAGHSERNRSSPQFGSCREATWDRESIKAPHVSFTRLQLRTRSITRGTCHAPYDRSALSATLLCQCRPPNTGRPCDPRSPQATTESHLGKPGILTSKNNDSFAFGEHRRPKARAVCQCEPQMAKNDCSFESVIFCPTLKCEQARGESKPQAFPMVTSPPKL